MPSSFGAAFGWKPIVCDRFEGVFGERPFRNGGSYVCGVDVELLAVRSVEVARDFRVALSERVTSRSAAGETSCAAHSFEVGYDCFRGLNEFDSCMTPPMPTTKRRGLATAAEDNREEKPMTGVRMVVLNPGALPSGPQPVSQKWDASGV